MKLNMKRGRHCSKRLGEEVFSIKFDILRNTDLLLNGIESTVSNENNIKKRAEAREREKISHPYLETIF
jgi:hypothetical protein